ncbi:MAG: hypothetical protein ACXVZI_00545 [Terriglobales bacterium]
MQVISQGDETELRRRVSRASLHSGAMIAVLIVLLFAGLGAAHGQWEMQESHTTANLRGIHAVNREVAWASGSEGTVLRTQDGGSHWQRCATPAGGDQLDFRGVWAWDSKTAVVMSAGPGEQSRLYKTSDGCAHWTEELRNNDKEGFWDAVVFESRDHRRLGDANTGVLIGDPLRGHFDTRVMVPGQGWTVDDASCAAREGEAAFAASNSSLFVFGSRRYVVVTGGKGGPRALLSPLLAYGVSSKPCAEAAIPLASGSDSAGAFSIWFRDLKRGMVLGGDYKKPGESSGTAAWTSDGGRHWTAAAKPPHGYRSAVGWYAKKNAWIAAGTNGSDVSRDDGKSWQPLDEGGWNAVSLPYVVGPKGRIGKLRAGAITR